MTGTCKRGNKISRSIKFGEFLEYLGPVSFFGRTLLHGVSK